MINKMGAFSPNSGMHFPLLLSCIPRLLAAVKISLPNIPLRAALLANEVRVAEGLQTLPTLARRQGRLRKRSSTYLVLSLSRNPSVFTLRRESESTSHLSLFLYPFGSLSGALLRNMVRILELEQGIGNDAAILW